MPPPKFMPFEEYMLKPREERRAHLDLDAPCLEIGSCSQELRGLLCFLRQTTMPKGRKYALCHACDNPKCSSPEHIYWGTASDNLIDQFAGASTTRKTYWQRAVEAYGEQGALDHMRANAARGGKANKGKRVSEETRQKLKDSWLRRKAAL